MINIILSNLKNQLKLSFSRELFKYILFIQPLMYSFIMYMIYEHTSDKIFLEYAVLGTGFLSFWSTILFSSASDIDRERIFGTLPILFISPCNFFIIIFSKFIGNSILSIIPICISNFILLILRPLNFDLNFPLFFLNFILGIFVLTLVATFFSLVFLLSKNSRLLMNSLEYPLYIISGIMFPIHILPSPIQIIANLFPLYWISQNIRSLLSGNLKSLKFIPLLYFIVAYLIIIKILYNKLITNIKIKGTLEMMD